MFFVHLLPNKNNRMKKHITALLALVACWSSPAQSVIKHNPQPKLVVSVVVDQMRYDYLLRFEKHYGKDGFKKLIKDGFNVENAHYNYVPTYTAVGHTSIFTGTTPSEHGIVGNNWYDRFEKKYIYCVDDNAYTTVGAANGGAKSPKRLLSTTFSDQLQFTQKFHGKVIGLAIKDRSAILPTGHTANGAYWFEGNDEGKFISSTFYMEELPQWVKNFNNSGKADYYMNQPWTTLLPIEQYTESIEDNNPYEGVFTGMDTPTFPYNLKELAAQNNNYNMIKETAWGNSITTDFAIAALKGENLGQSDFTDFLSISYSSTDYVGHKFGVDSKEIQDSYVRLDRDIARLLKALDKQVGKGNYTLFLTADHAAVPVPSYLKDNKAPGGYLAPSSEMISYIDNLTQEKYGITGLVEHKSNNQIFLNRTLLKSNNLELNQVSEYLAQELINFKDVYKVVSAHTLQRTNFDYGIMNMVQKGYNQKISGDVIYVTKPAHIAYSHTGSTHGSGFNYDTHVPVIFYGAGIQKGSTKKYHSITDIAPTISNFLGLSLPTANTGMIIEEALK